MEEKERDEERKRDMGVERCHDGILGGRYVSY